MICHRILSALAPHAHRAVRRIVRRVVRRHTHHAIAAVVSVVCVGGPVIVLTGLPPVVAPAAVPAPVHVPEPAGLAVLGVGVVALVVGRARR